MILPVKQKGTIRPGYFLVNQKLLFFVCKNNFFKVSKLKIVKSNYVLQFEHKHTFTHLLRGSYGAIQILLGVYLREQTPRYSVLYISCTNENQ